MPRREIDDEKKSYSGVFLLTVGLLLIGTVWAVWDDYITRRPWKKYQAQFSLIAYEKTQQELQEETERLAADPAYQEAVAKLAEARAYLDDGAGKQRVAELTRQLAAAELEASELENDLRIVRSEIEAAWYEYDHAIILGHSTQGEKETLEALQAEAEAIDKQFQAATARRDQIQKELDEINLSVRQWEDKLRELTQTHERIERRLDDAVLLSFNGFAIPVIPTIQQTVLPEFDHGHFDTPLLRVDRCQTCHAGIDQLGFEDQPNPFKTHPHRDVLLGPHVGCTPCHEGQGVALNSVAQAHGDVAFWEHPMLRGEKMQANCIKCHADIQEIALADEIAFGEALFLQLGCAGCHLVEGYGDAQKIGPYLRRVSAKVDPAWLVQWVTDPQAFRPHTRMPNFLFTEAQGRAIAAYLLDASKAEGEAWLAAHPEPDGIDPQHAELVQQGEDLVYSLGCRGCHAFTEEETATLVGQNKNFAPNLSRIADKTNPRWLYHWIKDPSAYAPHTAMPSLRLSDDEAQAIVSFLMTLGGEPVSDASRADLQAPALIAQGEGLVRRYGCHGCHEIPGMEKEARIGVELTTFGSKPLTELFFGTRSDIPHTWDDWTYYKLKNPQIYATERIEQLMPQFHLTGEDIKALRVFLASQTEGEIPDTYRAHNQWTEDLVAGQRLVQYYNCRGCHVIEGRGGNIRALYTENPSFAPPILNGEGEKVQPEWFYGFLQAPIPLRPWLQVRMPTFHLSDAEAQTVVNYFVAQAKLKTPYVYIDHAALSKEMLQAGETLMSTDYFACFSCHQQGDKKPEGPPEGWAPDLALAKERLNPEWIIEWIEDPQKLMPGTRMPSFYPGGPEDILDGNEPLQIRAMRDYMMVLGEGAGQMTSRTDEDVPAPAAPAAEEPIPDGSDTDERATS